MLRTIICTWNMTRSKRPAALAALLLTLAGCNGPAPSAQPGAAASVSSDQASGQKAAEESAARVEISSAPSSSLADAGQDRQIDIEPGSHTESRIVASEDIKVASEDACALTVQYAGDIEQPVTWRNARCEDLTMRFVDLSELTAIGQDGKLNASMRETIAGLPGRKVLYIESAKASAIFAPNEAGLLVRQKLAD
jgi:hypothetical protein